MRPITALRLDYWVGRVICAVISLASSIARVFLLPHHKVVIPKKILFLELSEMGAAILASTAIDEARKSYPGAELFFWIFKENADSVHILDMIPRENVITTRTDNLFVLFIDTMRNIIRLRRDDIDTVIDMELFSRFTSILCFLSGARSRVGFYKFKLEGLDRADVYTHKVIYNPYHHISKNFVALVRALGFAGQEPLLKMPLDDIESRVPIVKLVNNEIESMWKLLKSADDRVEVRRSRIVVLNPGVGEYLYLRRWPIEKYLELSSRFFSEPDTFVVFIGVKSESSEMERLEKLPDGGRFINLIGKTSVRDVVALCNIASLFISHDSGAVNLASLTPVDLIALFGPETPVLYAPLKENKRILYKNLACSPCLSAYNHRISSCRDNMCLKMISVEEVYSAAKDLEHILE